MQHLDRFKTKLSNAHSHLKYALISQYISNVLPNTFLIKFDKVTSDHTIDSKNPKF